MKGLVYPREPSLMTRKGESTAWYTSFWRFGKAAYLEHRFHKNWSLSPEQSSCRSTLGTAPFPASCPYVRPKAPTA